MRTVGNIRECRERPNQLVAPDRQQPFAILNEPEMPRQRCAERDALFEGKMLKRRLLGKLDQDALPIEEHPDRFIERVAERNARRDVVPIADIEDEREDELPQLFLARQRIASAL